jgi:hypothetical protein
MRYAILAWYFTGDVMNAPNTMEGIDFIEDSKEIFKEILKSKENGTIIGVTSPILGGFIYLTGVEDVVVDDTFTVYIVFQPCDTSGYFFPTRKVRLDKIYSVKPFSSKFENLWAEKKSSANDDASELLLQA